MTARQEILDRARTALGPTPDVPPIPRDYRAGGAAGATGDADVVALFAERVADYRATVHRCSESDLPAVLARLAGSRSVVASPRWARLLPGVAVTDDPPLSVAALDAMDTAITGCALAIAETGTIVLDGTADSGRRALTLVPDHHVCVVHAHQVVASVPDAIGALEPTIAEGRPVTFVSGPSATSDIELERVEGVHGPRRLDVVLLD
ncbi:MAG: LUD domain-containing protein [Patulibacter sp.]